MIGLAVGAKCQLKEGHSTWSPNLPVNVSTTGFDVRVSKGLYTRGYGFVRLSVIGDQFPGFSAPSARTYRSVSWGSCASISFSPISDRKICEAAAVALGLDAGLMEKQAKIDPSAPSTLGCHISKQASGNQLLLGSGTLDAKQDGLQQLLCQPQFYQDRFYRKWTSKYLETEIVHVGPVGTDVSMHQKKLHLSLPQPGTGVAGIIFSVPCSFSSATAIGPTCTNARQAEIVERLAVMLNQLLGTGNAFHFWAILGNNFYDQNGKVSTDFFERLSLSAKLKPLITVPGNYDFWAAGAPPARLSDSLGYGFMQFYGQDTFAAGAAKPFDFGGATEQLDQPAKADNFIFGSQLGDVAFFGYSGAHSWNETERHATSFCQHVGATDSITTAVVLGHWYECNEGCKAGMDVPSVHQRLGTMPGCKSKTLLYFAGHKHCNKAVSGGAGFLVGGAGMQDDRCPHFGITVLESVPKRGVRVDYFDLGTEQGGNGTSGEPDGFHQLMSCLASLGFAACRELHGVPFRTINTFAALNVTLENISFGRPAQVGNNSRNNAATSGLNTTKAHLANLTSFVQVVCCALGITLLVTVITGICYAVAWTFASSNAMSWRGVYRHLDSCPDKPTDTFLDIVEETTNCQEECGAQSFGEAVIEASRWHLKNSDEEQYMLLLRDASQSGISSMALVQHPDL